MQIGDYIVKPTCRRDENCLLNFLESNGFGYEKFFESIHEKNPYLIVINVIKKTYFKIDMYHLTGPAISEVEFLKKINCYPFIEKKELLSDDGDLLYEGYVLNDKPFGLGTVYYPNGNKYQEGIFDFKGLVEGREFYPSGQLRFEGIFVLHTGYGPNYPKKGNLYDEDGKLMFTGKFEVRRSGVGFPMMKYPRYGQMSERPKIKYVNTSDFDETNIKSRSKKINHRWELKFERLPRD